MTEPVKRETTIDDNDDIFDTGNGGREPKPSLWQRLQERVTTIGNSFAGKDEDTDF
jgi:hypothetical protein